MCQQEMYAGISDKARNIIKAYFGIEDKARQVKKGYIGVGNVARPFMDNTISGLVYYGQIAPLSVARSYPAGGSNSSYAIFAGGDTGSISAVVDAYNSSLTRSTISPLRSSHKYNLRTATIDDNILVAGGANMYITGYDASLTRIDTIENLSNTPTSFATTNNENFALISDGTAAYGNVYAYSKTLTKSIAPPLSVGRAILAATSIGEFALFGGGNTGTGSSVVDVYDSSLTRSLAMPLSIGRYYLSAASNNNYAIFAGGLRDAILTEIVDAYDSSLTRIQTNSLPQPNYSMSATSINGFAVFAGGIEGVNISKNVIAYDDSLTRIIPTNMIQPRIYAGATTIGNYAIIAGGRHTVGIYLDSAEAYTVL